MDRNQMLNHIIENSSLLRQLSYDKGNKNSFELRQKNGTTFVLAKFNDGKNGFDVYTNSGTNDLSDVLKQFTAL